MDGQTDVQTAELNFNEERERARGGREGGGWERERERERDREVWYNSLRFAYILSAYICR